MKHVNMKHVNSSKTIKKATFAGGCFWCMEKSFSSVPGVLEVMVGYCGGSVKDPSYEDVSTGKTGHYEVVQFSYDEEKIEFLMLLDMFWNSIDPTDSNGQFADHGNHYKTVIFYHDATQHKLAIQSKKFLEESRRFLKPIVTLIKPYEMFYPAEESHQDYYKKNSEHYNHYYSLSGRKAFFDLMRFRRPTPQLYQRPKDSEIQKKLTDEQYLVTQNNGTEKPFCNEFWEFEEEGLFVDVVTGEPLFSSIDKFESGTGWPSFSRPVEDCFIVEKRDLTSGMSRTEVKSRCGNSHLGHVFYDGPPPTGMRYCINSAALRFIPKLKLAEEGYGFYLYLFN